MIIKPIIRVWLICVLVSSNIAIANPQLVIGKNNTGGNPANFQMPITFTNDGSVVGIQFDLEYDSSEVTLLSPTAGTNLPVANVIGESTFPPEQGRL